MKYLKIALIVYLVIFAGLVLFQRLILLHPEKLDPHYIYEFEDGEEFYVVPSPTVQLNALRFPSKDSVSKGVVLYFHGNAYSLARWGRFAEEFTKRGYDVVMYDYRGFGKSNGRLDEKNLLSDAQQVLDDLRRRYPPAKMILYGRSLGTGVATKLASENKVKMLILEAPYYSIPDIAWSHVPLFPYKLVSEFQIPLYQWLPKVSCPVHIFHGTNDGVVPYSQSIKLIESAKKNPKEILTTLEGGKHRGLQRFKEYQTKLDELLKN